MILGWEYVRRPNEAEREHCRVKTARGNAYRHKKEAVRSAQRMRRQRGGRIQPFRCACCGLFHLGNRRAE